MRIHPGTQRSLVVALHGRGGSADHFASMWQGTDLEVAVPDGFTPFAHGYEWFDWPRGLSEQELADRLIAVSDRLWPTLTELAAGRKLIVTGFSQGAVLSFVLAARHPEAVAYAVPIAGRAPPPIFLPGRVPAPVYAVHGSDDEVIPLFLDRATIAAFKEHGGTAELHEVAGVGHTITAAMLSDVIAHIRAH